METKLYPISFHIRIPDKLKKDKSGREVKYARISEEQYKIAYNDYDDGQSMERIIERGGFGILELAYSYGKDKWDHVVWFSYEDEYPTKKNQWVRVKFNFPPTFEEFKKNGYSFVILPEETYDLKCKQDAVLAFIEAFEFCSKHYNEPEFDVLNKKLCDGFVDYFKNVKKENDW